MKAQEIVALLLPASLELEALRQQAEQLTALGRYTAATACDAQIASLEEAIRQEASRLVAAAAGGWGPQRQRQRTYTVALRLLGLAE